MNNNTYKVMFPEEVIEWSVIENFVNENLSQKIKVINEKYVIVEGENYTLDIAPSRMLYLFYDSPKLVDINKIEDVTQKLLEQNFKDSSYIIEKTFEFENSQFIKV